MRLLGIAFMVLLFGAVGAAFFVWPSFSSQLTAPPPLRAHMVLEVDRDTLRAQELETTREQLVTLMRVVSPAIALETASTRDGVLRIELADQTETARALSAVDQYGTGENLSEIVSPQPGLLEARITDRQLDARVSAAAQQNAEILRRRLSTYGNRASIDIAAGNRLRVSAATPADLGRMRMLIEPGQLSFHLVREVSPQDAAAGALPIGAMLAPPHRIGSDQPEVVERRARMTGEDLIEARPKTDAQTGEFVVSFSLNSEGARRFCVLTRRHTGERFAVLLDGQVLTAPLINEPICGGEGQISGNFTAESANALAILLSGGALAAPMKIVEEHAEGQPPAASRP